MTAVEEYIHSFPDSTHIESWPTSQTQEVKNGHFRNDAGRY